MGNTYIFFKSLLLKTSLILKILLILLSITATKCNDTVRIPFDDHLASIKIQPINNSIIKGSTFQFTAEGTFKKGSIKEIPWGVRWESSNPEIATIDESGLVTAVAEGQTQITATWGVFFDTKNLTVTDEDKTIETIYISNDQSDLSIKTWKKMQYTAIGRYDDGTEEDITEQVSWSSSDTEIAKISDSVDSKGLATGITAGTVNITASLGVVSDFTTLTIKNNFTILKYNGLKDEVALSGVIDNMGRIILCGYVQIPGEDQDAALWRYFLDGTMDTSFGTNGRITWDSPMGNDDELFTVKINPNGDIMVGGYASNDPSRPVNPSILMGKFDSNGQPDTSFSPDGFKVITSAWSHRPKDSTFDSDGKLLTSGFVDGDGVYDIGLLRTTNSGNIDTSFATNGYFQSGGSEKEYGTTVLVEQGNIYLSGTRDWENDSLILKMDESDGSIIDIFIGIPFKNRSRTTFIRDDYIYIAGYTVEKYQEEDNKNYFGWAKINKNDLTYDTNYGTGGYRIHNNNPGGRPNSVYVNSKGESYIGGFQFNDPQDGYMLKITNTGEVDTDWANNGVMLYSDLDFDGSIENIYSVLMHNSEMVIVGNTEVILNSTPYKRIFLDVAPENHMPGDKDILSFNFAASENSALSSDVIGTVNESTIDVAVPDGTDMSSLVADIRINGAALSHADGDAVDYSAGPVILTVTAVDLTSKNYTVNISTY